MEAGQQAIDIIRDIRAMFAGHLGTLSEFDLNGLVHETAALLGRELAAHDVAFQVDLDEALPPILASRVQVQRVLANLLTNAIESLAATRGRSRSVTVRTALDGQSIMVEVSDSGAGIAPEKMAKIFDPFFTTKPSGSGLGLSLSRTIIEEHGGRLWASTGGQHGAQFNMKLPLRPQPARSLPEPQELRAG
jgi:signal transduction histidine kinase